VTTETSVAPFRTQITREVTANIEYDIEHASRNGERPTVEHTRGKFTFFRQSDGTCTPK
jgi:hypothetical protein